MSTQINVTDALRGAEAGLEVAIQRILKRDPGHAVHVTSEAKALVVVRQALSQCNGCAVQQGYVPMGQIVHPDDLAVDALAKAMKAKLAKKRAQGYGGWDTDCTQQRLSDLLRKHVDKGDPVDVANFCAFLHARDESITAAPQAEMRITRIDDGPILSVERLDPATNKFVVVAEAGKKSGAPAAVQQGYVPVGAVAQIQDASRLPEIKDMLNSPQTLSNNDRAFWVLGWNECRDAAKSLIAHIAELEAQLAAVQQGVQSSPETASIAPTFMTNDQAIAWAWADVRKDVGTENWTTGDSCNFYGFFLHGWHYRGQYELQRNATKAAKFNRLELEIRSITKMLPEKFDCSGVWAAFEAAQAKQGEQANG